ncbi:Methionine-R-sulfoxide reductase B3, mitochondrial, partial [Varanus komodoensis]
RVTVWGVFGWLGEGQERSRRNPLAFTLCSYLELPGQLVPRNFPSCLLERLRGLSFRWTALGRTELLAGRGGGGAGCDLGFCLLCCSPFRPAPPLLSMRAALPSLLLSCVLLSLFFASGCVGEDITVMSAFNLLHLVTKSQPVALRACGLPSGSCRDKKNCKVVFSQQELRKRLTPLQYHVTQEKGTESAFEGEYTYHKAHGIYKCVVCGTPLFKDKIDSDMTDTCLKET